MTTRRLEQLNILMIPTDLFGFCLNEYTKYKTNSNQFCFTSYIKKYVVLFKKNTKGLTSNLQISKCWLNQYQGRLCPEG